MRKLADILLVLSLCAVGAAAQVYVHAASQSVVVGNRYLERTIAVRDGVVGTTALRNKISGREYSFAGDEFRIELIYERVGYEAGSENPWVLTARDFRVLGREIASAPGGGRRITFHLGLRPGEHRRPRLGADLVYELRPGEFFTRQWLRLTVSGTGTYFMDRIAVLQDRIGVAHFTLGGFGQPLFAGDLFCGLEYPASENTVRGGLVSLARVVGEDIPPGGFTTEAAVLGVAAAGGVHRQFMDYVARIRVAPVRPYLLYNTWFDLQSTHMNHANTLERAAALKRILVGRYGLHLDSFVLDDSWDDFDHLWKIDPRRFPGGFGDLAAALGGMHSGLGLWFGPIGGYSNRSLRLTAGRRLGMEITSNGQFLCLAGRNYSRYFTDSVLDYEKQYRINYFKLDGIPFGCNDPTHGHPVGIYSREADMRVFLGLLDALRRANPKVFLNLTTSIWLSPWWLEYGDTVWMGGEDSGYLPAVPTLTPRQSAISYRDSVLYDDFARQRYQFPLSSIMTHGIIKGQYNELGGARESAADWDDAIVHYFSVGNMMYELYITPDLLSGEEWRALAGGIHWAEANAHPLLDNATLIGGDPARREPYGFVHASPAETIVTLRNPFVAPRAMRVKLDAANGFLPAPAPLAANVIYPYREALPRPLHYGDTLTVDLGAYEQEVLALRPASEKTLRIEGARYGDVRAEGDSVSLTLYGAPGTATEARASEARGGAAIEVAFGGKRGGVAEPIWSAPALAIDGAPGTARVAHLALEVTLPHNFARARLALLLEPPSETEGLTAQASDNGRPAAVSVEDGGHGQWYWFTLPLGAGRHRLQVELSLPASLGGGAKISAWLLADRMLAARRVTLRLAPGYAPPAPDLLPQRPAAQAETYSLLTRTLN